MSLSDSYVLQQLSADLLLAFLIGWLEGTWGGITLIHQLRWQPMLAGLCRWLERRLNRERRSDATRVVRGLLVALVLVIPAILIGLLLTWLAAQLHPAYAAMLVGVLLFGSLRLGIAWRTARRIRQAVKHGRHEQAGRLIDTHGHRNASAVLDDHGRLRAAVEIAARGLDRGLIAPLFWFVLLGLPGLFTLVVVQAADDVMGTEDERLEAYGLVVGRLDMVLHLIPSRLAGLLLLASIAILRPARLRVALASLRKAARDGAPANGRWVLAPLAGALELSLGGPLRQQGHAVARPWIGDGTARLQPDAINRSFILLLLTCVLFSLLLMLALTATLIHGL